MDMASTPASGGLSPRTFTLASRASQLARIQTNIVLSTLQKIYPQHTFQTSFMSTEGDKNQSQALYLLGGKALWTKELEVALQENACDMLIHSLKDVPTTLPEGCEIGAVLEREDPVDCLIVKEGLKWKTLEELPKGSVVGTSSVRRVAQLKRKFSELVFLNVRGNLNTRMAKLDAPDSPFTAIILAKAGMVRLGMGHRCTSDLTAPILYHAVSQGALGVEVRSNDPEVKGLCEGLTHWQTFWRCWAEREYLRVLEGGCSVPVGIDSMLTEKEEGKRGGVLKLTGCVTALDGVNHVEETVEEEVTSVGEAEGLGAKLARRLMSKGGKAILDDITKDRERMIKGQATV